MPKQGFKSITVNGIVVDRIKDFIKNNRGKTIPQYIYSPAQLLEYYEEKMNKDKAALANIARKITKIPLNCRSYPL